MPLGPFQAWDFIFSGTHSSLFLTAGDLALDLLTEFEGVRDFLEHFGSSAGTSNDDRSVAEQPAHGRLFYGDAFNPC